MQACSRGFARSWITDLVILSGLRWRAIAVHLRRAIGAGRLMLGPEEETVGDPPGQFGKSAPNEL
eukprot:2441896-Pyramimonas_sp.AAC.1